MVTAPVGALITQLSVPTITSMLITAIYNMADTFFVSQLGTSASGAVGIVFSIMAVIQAVGFTLGMGSGSIISQLLGKKDVVRASEIASSAFAAAVVFGTAVAGFGTAFSAQLMKLLGATDTIVPFARDYARFILPGAPVMCAAFVMNNVLRAEGHAAFSMIGLTAGGILNIVLDPLFIFGFGLGTAGAAIATLISQCVSFCILLQFFIRRKGIVRLRGSYVARQFRVYGSIIAMGMPSLARQGLASVSTVMLNHRAAAYGDAAVAAVSIVMRIIILVASVMIGIGQGFTPVSGYNYGARKYRRVRDAYRFTVCAGAAVLAVAAVVLVIGAPYIIARFRDDAAVIAIGTAALRFQAVTLPLHAFIVGTNMLMQSTGKAAQATFLSCNRQGIFFIPLIVVLPLFFGLTGIEATQAGADILSALTAIPFMVWFLHHLPDDGQAASHHDG
ncbi:MAG: MATE family efflux transporter [Treponema sp.]|nr:MATE family efflux transporter [Treponema sp.]